MKEKNKIKFYQKGFIEIVEGERNLNFIVKEAIDYINKHVDEKLQIEEIAKTLYVSKFYFCRLFKKEMGVTPKQYTIQAKLRIIKRKIWEEESETKIAQDLGFASQSHMCSLFKKYMGITIREYKNNYKVSNFFKVL